MFDSQYAPIGAGDRDGGAYTPPWVSADRGWTIAGPVYTYEGAGPTELKWDANTDADIAGYEVVWRDTTAAEWTNAKFVGNVLTYTAKGMSKDNYFFGVRAVDKAGNKSPVVYPRPMR